ncbi:MAG TPA: carboxypeptidase-like regulatory domain-containing protein [Bryobacteraceae bacterium]|nr:carboxypeptidase-like regulatory domain-containing protein [Bryobacteraceae bacterium]
MSFTLTRFRSSRILSGLTMICLGILVLALGSTPVWAQATSNASIAGIVTDEQNAAIPGAEVKVTDTGTGISQTTITNDAGRYVFANVVPGTYSILVTKQGFTVFKVAAQDVAVGTALTINAVLKVGSTSTTVEVTATIGADLQTTNATVGSTLTQAALLSLPNMGRDVSTLAVLQPGTTPNGMTAGAFSDQNVFMLDGGNNSDDMAGNNTSYVTNFTGTGGTQTGGSPSGIIPTSVESVEEVRVSTFNQTADFSGSIGGQIQMVTKRGSNQYHGAAYGYYFATNLGAANSWVNNHTPAAGLPYTPLPKNHRDRFGGSLGGVLLPKLAGGKTYFFVNYEGSRFPNVGTYERLVPTPLLRAGVIQVADASGKYQAYNLNPSPVTVNGVTYQPASCGTGLCDPRGLGLNPTIAAIWKEMPLPNDPIYGSGDQYNTQGYLTTIRAPLNQNSYVARIDHDFGDKNRFFGTYRYTKITNLTTNQVDIGGVLPGDTFGTATPLAPRPQLPSFMVFGLTTSISPTITNTVNFNYTRNFWQWGASNAYPQVPGLGGMVEIGGESTNALIPYNINSQSVRQRFWDGQDKTLKDDVTMIKGNHLIQFGGLYQRNFDYHARTDNGQGINNQIVYQVTSSNTNFGNFSYPSAVPTSQQSNWNTYYSYVMGFVAQSQVVYTRTGSNLTLGPIGSSGFDKSVIPYYNLYASDTWHLKPTVTLTYGLSYQIEMPPVEQNGKQVSLVDQNGNQVPADQYLQQRAAAALAGQADQPIFGFALTPNIAGHPKYPYDPFYGGLSPRVSVAWNPKYSSGLLGTLFGDNKTVIRAGYGRIFGRLNGVNLLLVPLLPPGLLQAVSCTGVSKGGQCLLNNGVDPSTVFRIGVDGNTVPLPNVSQTLSQPYFPGVGGNAGASDVTFLDPHYRPERTDNFTVTLQRQISKSQSIEVGYVGRLIRNELQALNLDAVPYMMTLGGQTFASAFAQTYFAVAAGGTPTPQPFFENALGGANSAYCQGYASCTAAVAAKNTTSIKNTAVSDLWTALYKAPSWTLGRTMLSAPLPGQTTSQGYTFISNSATGFGNYNALFVSYHLREFHGFSGNSNFTWGRALGTGTTSQATSSNTGLDVYNLQNDYGPQSYDYKFIYNFALYYSPKVFRNQHGPLGKVLGGWTFSPLFTAQSGAPIFPSYSEGGCTGCESFGEVSTTSSATTSFITSAQGTGPYSGGTSTHYNVAGSGGVGTNNPSGVNFFADPASVLGEFRRCILGFDTNCESYTMRGLPRWNVDLSVVKSVNFWREGVGADFHFLFTNVFNHNVLSNPTLSLTTPTTFGRITGSASTPRNMEFGIRLHF